MLYHNLWWNSIVNRFCLRWNQGDLGLLSRLRDALIRSINILPKLRMGLLTGRNGIADRNYRKMMTQVSRRFCLALWRTDISITRKSRQLGFPKISDGEFPNFWKPLSLLRLTIQILGQLRSGRHSSKFNWPFRRTVLSRRRPRLSPRELVTSRRLAVGIRRTGIRRIAHEPAKSLGMKTKISTDPIDNGNKLSNDRTPIRPSPLITETEKHTHQKRGGPRASGRNRNGGYSSRYLPNW